MTVAKKIYQGKYKERFINIQSDSKKEVLVWLFNKSYSIENELGKDLFDFNKTQMKDFLTKEISLSKGTIITYKSWISSYIEWAIKNCEIKTNNRNVLDEFTKDDWDEIVAKEQEYFHVDEIYKLIGRPPYNDSELRLKNAQDELLVYLIFLGVKGNKASDLINLQYKHIDFDNKKILLSELDPNNNDIPVDNFTLNLINKAKNEKEYFRYFDNSSSPYNAKESFELAESPYVFRRSAVGKGKIENADDPKISYVALLSRLETISEYIGKTITMKKIEKSSMLYITYKLLTLKNSKLTPKDEYIQAAIFDRFNIRNKNSQYIALRFIKEELPKIYTEYEGKL